eukprot:4739907-Pyramimonas_sp.AAC.1
MAGPRSGGLRLCRGAPPCPRWRSRATAATLTRPGIWLTLATLWVSTRPSSNSRRLRCPSLAPLKFAGQQGASAGPRDRVQTRCLRDR